MDQQNWLFYTISRDVTQSSKNAQTTIVTLQKVFNIIELAPLCFYIRLNCGPLFWDALKQNHCRLSLRVLADIKTHKTHKPNSPVLASTKDWPQTEIEIEPDLKKKK